MQKADFQVPAACCPSFPFLSQYGNIKQVEDHFNIEQYIYCLRDHSPKALLSNFTKNKYQLPISPYA
jgi:hypothetical protein